VPRPAESTEGVIGRLVAVGERDQIATLLTTDRGRLDVMARGARGGSKRFGGALQPFARVQAQVRQGRGRLPVLVQAEVLHQHLGRASYGALCVGAWLLELGVAAAQPDLADPQLDRWLSWALGGLDALPGGGHDAHIAALLLAAEAGYLHVLGLLPDLQGCSRCGRSTVGGADWPPGGEGLVCASCWPESGERLSADTLLVLDGLLGDLATSPGRVLDTRLAARLPAADRKRLERRLRRAIADVVPGTPRSRRSLDAWLATRAA
jgi:DNA repair protein RecO (recombination protein O)